MSFVQFKELFFFIVGPWFFVDCRVKVVVPSLPALLAGSFRDVIDFLKLKGNLCPVIEAVLSYQLRNGLVFLNQKVVT